MTNEPNKPSRRFLNLTTEEMDSIKRMLRYALSIFAAVAVTLVVVALLSSLLTG